MGLQTRSVEKLLRDGFPGKNPLVVKSAAREKLGAEIAARLERIDGVDTKGHVYYHAEGEERLVASFF